MNGQDLIGQNQRCLMLVLRCSASPIQHYPALPAWGQGLYILVVECENYLTSFNSDEILGKESFDRAADK